MVTVAILIRGSAFSPIAVGLSSLLVAIVVAKLSSLFLSFLKSVVL